MRKSGDEFIVDGNRSICPGQFLHEEYVRNGRRMGGGPNGATWEDIVSGFNNRFDLDFSVGLAKAKVYKYRSGLD